MAVGPVSDTAAYARFVGVPSRVELERYFFLDDADRDLVGKRRGDHNRLGFAVQLTTVRYLGAFLADPVDVPAEVVDYLAEQLAIQDPSCLKRYTRRESTVWEHAGEIRRIDGWRDFSGVRNELTAWVEDRSWTTGEGAKALFDRAVAWLRERRVLLPGPSLLSRLIAKVQADTNQRLWDTLYDSVTDEQRRSLDDSLVVPDGARSSLFDQLRRGPGRRSGPEMVKALDRVAEINSLGVGGIDLSAIPARRVANLARYGLTGKAPALRRHPANRRVATMLAAVQLLEARAVDDALELFDLLMVSDLLARAQRESNKERLRRYPWVSADAGKLAAAVEVLFETTEYGENITVEQLWESIEAVVPRAELRAAVDKITDVAPPLGSDPVEDWRAELTRRLATVRGFVGMLCEVIPFGATSDGAPVLAALQALPEVLAHRSRRLPGGQIPERLINPELLGGEWRRLVYRPGLPDGVVDKAGWVFCVLERFHRALRRRDIYTEVSLRWRDPRAQLLDGDAWARAKPAALNALGLAENPDPLLAAHARLLDASYREVGGRLVVNTQVTVDDQGKLHVSHLEAIPDPPSLTDLRNRLEAMLPRVDLPEVLLEVMRWEPRFLQAFTAVSGHNTRLDDLDVTLAAVLTAHSLNIGFTPVTSPATPALTRDRLSHVDQNYLRAETISAANAPLIEAQSRIDLAQAWGGGLVAAIDGMRFVVPIPTIHARPNPTYFGRGRGSQWLNMINDQALGLGAKALAGTPRDSLYAIDVIYSQDGGPRPEVIVTDTATYTDVVFGLLHLLGFSYRPELADLPDQKLWRIDADADYGPLNTAARGKIDLGIIRRHWPDVLRVVASIHTGTITAHDALRVLTRDGKPTPLGSAVGAYGRIFKSIHVLTYIDDEPYRRDIKAMRNLQETRHDLARKVFHGQKGELRQRYHEGMEDQLGALGIVLNCITLWNTVYLSTALDTLRRQGYPVLADDVARLSPFMRRHINVHGHYTFRLPDIPGRYRPLRDPDRELDDD